MLSKQTPHFNHVIRDVFNVSFALFFKSIILFNKSGFAPTKDEEPSVCNSGQFSVCGKFHVLIYDVVFALSTNRHFGSFQIIDNTRNQILNKKFASY